MARKHCIIPLLLPKDLLHFWKKVRVRGLDECWEWQANTSLGYGKFGIGRKRFRSHRVAWRIANGPIPLGLCVLHRCDNRRCCNPNHLFLGTLTDNNHDRDRKGRACRPCGDENPARKHPERLLRGEQCPWAKLTKQKVRNVRRRYAQGESQAALAREMGVGATAIKRIVLRKTWSHVP